MEIKLYTTTSTNNTIGKVLENETIFNVKFKGIASIKTPLIELLTDDNIFKFNYAYIEKFNRYYFIDKIDISPNNVYSVSLSVDVLESFKNDILQSKGFISRQTEINNYYDTGYESEVKKEVDIFKSNVSINLDDSSTILVTIGGV